VPVSHTGDVKVNRQTVTEDPSRVKKDYYNQYPSNNQYPNNQYGNNGYNQYNQYPNQYGNNINNPYPNNPGVGPNYNFNANNNFNLPYQNNQNLWPNNIDYNPSQNGIQRPTYPPEQQQELARTVPIYPGNWQKDFPYGQSVNYYARGGCGQSF
jgi:hypothetical protein